MIQCVTPNNYGFFHKGKVGVDYYNQQVTLRRDKYPLPFVDGEQKYQNEIDELNKNGFVVFKQAIQHDIIERILERTDKIIEQGHLLKAKDEHYAVVADPFINVPEILDIAFSDHLINFASEYFKCVPGIGTFNLRKSYINDLPPKGTQFFHVDRNSIKFFKFFIYMNDVDCVEDGPLTLVKKSGNKRPFNHSYQHRWSEEQIKQIYGNDSLVYLTAKKGDLIAAPTSFYHRGTKPSSKERTMLTLNYGIHQELEDGNPTSPAKWFKIKQNYCDSLPEWKKPVADFLTKV